MVVMQLEPNILTYGALNSACERSGRWQWQWQWSCGWSPASSPKAPSTASARGEGVARGSRQRRC
eukprot:5309746-Pyramimonas_sp.AAC.1